MEKNGFDSYVGRGVGDPICKGHGHTILRAGVPIDPDLYSFTALMTSMQFGYGLWSCDSKLVELRANYAITAGVPDSIPDDRSPYAAVLLVDEGGLVCTFSGFSWGAWNACTALIPQYKMLGQKQFPVVKLGTTVRKNQFSTIDPVLRVVGWAPRANFAAITGEEPAQIAISPPKPVGFSRYPRRLPNPRRRQRLKSLTTKFRFDWQCQSKNYRARWWYTGPVLLIMPVLRNFLMAQDSVYHGSTEVENQVDLPAKPKKGVRSSTDRAEHSRTQPSFAKVIELTKQENAPAANILGGKPGSGPDPFDLESAVIDQTYLNKAAAEDVKRGLPLRKPGRREWFRTSPIYETFNVHEGTVKGKFEKDYYLVMPPMANVMRDDTYLACMILCVNSDGNSFLWPLRSLADSKAGIWAETAWDAVEISKESWVRIYSPKDEIDDGNRTGYKIKKSPIDLGSVEFPASDRDSYIQLLKDAVKEDHMIASPEHEVYLRLEGLQK